MIQLNSETFNRLKKSDRQLALSKANEIVNHRIHKDIYVNSPLSVEAIEDLKAWANIEVSEADRKEIFNETD